MYDDMNNNSGYNNGGSDSNGSYGNGNYGNYGNGSYSNNYNSSYNNGGYNNSGYNNGSYNSDQSVYDKPLTRKAKRAMKKVQKLDRKRAAGNDGKKGMNKFAKGAVAVACAVVLGAVAGVACYGVSYAGYSLFPIKNSAQEAKADTATDGATQVNKETTSVKKDIKATVYDVSDIVDNVITSVVAINGQYTEQVNYGFFGSQTYQSKVSGSGIIIGKTDEELLVVTNAHVIDNVDDLAVTLYDGNEISASVKDSKSSYDLAVLSVKLSDIPDGANYTIATLGDSQDIRVGEAAIAVGNSMGYGISVTTGCISALNKTVTVENTEYKNLIQTDAAINPGNSGGALFNAQGEVIGINSVKMKETGVEGMGYAISISSVRDIIDDLSTAVTRDKLSDDERGYLGITGVSITEDISKTYGQPVGVAVRSVSDDSAAANAGLLKNDIIVSFDGKNVSTIDELVSMMSYYAQGDTVKVEFYRLNSEGEYEKQSVDVTLTAKPEN